MLHFVVHQRQESLVLNFERERHPYEALLQECVEAHSIMPPCRRVLLQEAPVQGGFGLQWVERVLKIDSCIPEKDFYRRVAKLVPESVRVHQASFFVPKIPHSTVWFCLVAWAQFEVKPLVDIRI